MTRDLVIFLQQVFNALAISSIYILLAVGITLIFGLTRVVNFAQAQFLVLGSFLGYTLVTAGVSFWLMVPIVALAVGCTGVVAGRLVLRRVIDDPMAGFIATFGLAIALSSIFVKIWSPARYQIPSPVRGFWEIAGVRIGHDRALVIAVTVVAVVSMFVLLGRTQAGREMRAVAESREAAAYVGIPVGLAISQAFFLGSLMAGLAGALLGVVFPFTAFSGGLLLVKGLGVAIIGGLGSIRGAVVAGLLVGVVETFAVGYGVPIGFSTLGPEWRDGYIFLLMIALLAWRPTGLFRGVGEGHAVRQ